MIRPLQIQFGLQLGEEIYPHAKTELGIRSVNEKGLLQILETQLGLEGRDERVEHLRTEQYRQALKRHLSETSDAFYVASFHADSLGTAETLLAYRDELLLAGWDFLNDANTPNRLKTIALIESDIQKNAILLHGFADRWMAVLEALETRQVALDTISVHEPMALLSPHFRRLFQTLTALGVTVQQYQWDFMPSEKDDDLSFFKQSILSNDADASNFKRRAFRNDGSIQIWRAERDTDAAIYFAQYLRLRPSYKPLLLLPEKTRLLDNALTAESLASLGLPSVSSARPTLQLLRLVTAFLWEPLDPHKVLEFVTLANKPLNDSLAFLIARLVSQRPGIGGEYWNEQIDSFFNALSQKTDTDAAIVAADMVQQYRFWFERKRHRMNETVSVEEVTEVFAQLQSWASEAFDSSNGKATSLMVLAEQAQRIQDFLMTLPLENEQLTHLELERIVRTIYEPAPVQPSPREVNSLDFIAKTAAICAKVPHLVWWNFVETESNTFFSRWYQDEIRYLSDLKIELQSPQNENALQVWQRQLPIFCSAEQLTLCIPKAINGEETKMHPLMSNLEACFDELEGNMTHIGIFQSDVPLQVAQMPQFVSLEPKPLACAEAILLLDRENLAKRETETPTSIEKLFYYPHQWLLQHRARLSAAPIFDVASGVRLQGNLAHLIFEYIFKQDFKNWQRADCDKQIETFARNLFRQEGATMLMYGEEPTRVRFLRQVKQAVWSLLTLVRDNGWQVTATEEAVKGAFDGVTQVNGKVDLLLEKAGEKAVVDIKLGGNSRRLDMIKNGEDLQLILYAQFTTPPEEWAHTAYFIIENARLIARNTLAFKEVVAIFPDEHHATAYQRIWEKMQATYRWRKKQLKLGQVEIRIKETINALEEAYANDDLIPLLEMKRSGDAYDNYHVLLGVFS
jgi:ATP-dependent helicase/nuclease subunit B